MLKRIFDIVLAFFGLVLFAPLLLICALLIKLTSSGPVFYRGERIGLAGKAFRTLKFRTMVADAEKKGGSSTHEADARITGIGSFLRKFKLDELPQLLNVLAGDMSFVGPRPEVRKFVDMYTPEERMILTVRPGITDWSSIKFHNEGEIIAASGIADFNKLLAWGEQHSPLRRNVSIEEVGNAAAFLMSDLASGITGEITYVDSGFNSTAGLAVDD